MSLRALISLFPFAALACVPRAPAPGGPSAPEPVRNFYDCPAPAASARAHAKCEEAKKRLLACNELCQKTSNGAFGMIQAEALLHEAARDGDLEAQALYAKTTFEFAFLNNTDENLPKDEVVESLAYLRLAALRGSEPAQDFMPALAKLAIDRNEALSGAPEPPLDKIPRDWLVRALTDAERALGCYPKK